MVRVIPLCVFLFFISSALIAKDATYYSAKVKDGENIPGFLNRHNLSPHVCNIDLFCDINKIKNRNVIIARKEYLLPVKLYKFNGKSIRSTLGIKDKEVAKRIELFNTKLVSLGIKPNTKSGNDFLWVPLEEFDCKSKSDTKEIVSEKEVTIKKSDVEISPVENTKENNINISVTRLKRIGIKEIKVPLMGPGYELVNIEDFTLEGQVYYIISGHGGPDPGAVCTECAHDLCEDEYAYDVSLRLARNLMQHGATVHMIVQDGNDGIRDDHYLKCDSDEKHMGLHTIPISQKKRLRDRASTVNTLYNKYKKSGVKIQKAIEIHVDSRSKEKRQDVFFYYNKNNAGSKKLANTVQEVFESKYSEHQKDRGYKGFVEDRCLYMVRCILPTNIFVELANIRNFDDQKRLLINTNRQALANWLFEGLRK
ncbi:MAG: N-acetylmuramoyl-L-alanine amidase [Saprospiraceae bacterium]|nr:N-acetylmuramoyl-L-alanine amidase [Saprospiraceae bacterium]